MQMFLLSKFTSLKDEIKLSVINFKLQLIFRNNKRRWNLKSHFLFRLVIVIPFRKIDTLLSSHSRRKHKPPLSNKNNSLLKLILTSIINLDKH